MSSPEAQTLPAPVTARTEDDAPTPSKWIRFGKIALLVVRGILVAVAVAAFISTIIVSTKNIEYSAGIFGASIYTLVLNTLAILFTFKWKPFHADGLIATKLSGVIRVVRRWPGIPLTIIDVGGIALMTVVTTHNNNESWEVPAYQAMYGLGTALGMGHWTTMCGGWMFGLICIFKKCCCGGRSERNEKKKQKLEQMYEKARAERKQKELEEQNKVVVTPEIRAELKKMTKKERLEAAYERARIEREMVEKMVKEETTAPVVSPSAPAGEAVVEHFGVAETQPQKKIDPEEWAKMTKKERLEAKYEQARIERETAAEKRQSKVKGKGRADDMV